MTRLSVFVCSRDWLSDSSRYVGLKCCAAKAFAQVVFAPARNKQLCNPANLAVQLASATAAETKGVTESTYKNAESLIKLQGMKHSILGFPVVAPAWRRRLRAGARLPLPSPSSPRAFYS